MTPASPATPPEKAAPSVPPVSPFILTRFQRYTRRHLARHFHSFRLSRDGAPPPIEAGRPLVVFGNHASWWDPLTALYLTSAVFTGRTAYAPIDDAALQRYGILKRLGFFGVDRESAARGAAQFIATVRAVLETPGAMLWLTPQGNFADPRTRPLVFEPGLAHIAKRFPDAALVPMATEYPFWEERFPEVLVRFGPPVDCSGATTTEARLEVLQDALAAQQDALAAESLARNPAAFEIFLSGKSGASPVYDLWRRTTARLRGKTFDPEHGRK